MASSFASRANFMDVGPLDAYPIVETSGCARFATLTVHAPVSIVVKELPFGVAGTNVSFALWSLSRRYSDDETWQGG